MPLLRIVRAWGFAPVIGLVGFVIGCSGGGGTATPLEKGEGKEIRAGVKEARKAAQEARKQARAEQRSAP